MLVRLKRHLVYFLLGGLAVAGLVWGVAALIPPDDAACLSLLRDHGLHPSHREETGMGVGAMSGADFLAGAGDITFTEYVTLARGIDIQPDDRLKGYEYILEEVAIERPFHVYFLEREGEIICAALWSAKILRDYDEDHPGTYRGSHDWYTYWDISTPLETVRREMLAQILELGKRPTSPEKAEVETREGGGARAR